MSYETYGDMYAQAQAEAEQESLGLIAKAERRPDSSGIIDGETLEDQIAREIKLLLSEVVIKAQKDKGSAVAYIQDQAAWIARGAAFKALRIERMKNVRVAEIKVDAGSEAEVAQALEAAMVETFGTGKISHLVPPTEMEFVDPIIAYLERQWEWSMRTFGPGMRTTGVLNHIRKETAEVEENPFDLMEWVDIMILALDGFWRHGGSAARLMTLLQFKQDKNFARNWPDWRERSEDQPIEHDRSGEKLDVK